MRRYAISAVSVLMCVAAQAFASHPSDASQNGAQPAATATPSSTPAPTPSATQRPLGLHVQTSFSATLIDSSTAGQGQVGPEAAGFAAGSPLAPNTPYDLFSSAPDVPGIAGIGQVVSNAVYGLRKLDVGLTAGLGYVNGSVTNAAYWGENLLPALNPHVGSAALPYAIVFPTHAGQDGTTTLRASILGGKVATADGALVVRGGWFDLTQTDRFVFAPAALTSVNPAIAYAPAESLSSGLAGADRWQPEATVLPLAGIDATLHRGSATLELSNAALPSLPGDSARMSIGSLVVDHGEGTRFSAEALHLSTSGTPFSTTIPFGTDPQFTPTPQGVLPTSFLSGQQETIAGVRGAFHVDPRWNLDGIVEIAHAWYDAAPVARPGTEGSGGFYHAGLTKRLRRVTASADWYRMEPRYATAILPYGIPENQWSTAFAWPGQWLKSNYQLVDNSVLGINRQGFRVRYYVDGGPLEVHAEYTRLHQIEPETTETATQSGFIDGFYLPQDPTAATFGTQKRYGLWVAWHPAFGDLSLDVVDYTLYRPFLANHPEDQVSYEVPQAVATFSRHVSPSVEAAVGLGRYAIKGAFSEPVDFAERLYFAGIVVNESSKHAILVSFRRTIFGGMTTFPRSPLSPNFTGSTIILEQRVKL